MSAPTITEETVRADHLTPDLVGRKVLVHTAEGASLMGEIAGYTIEVEREDDAVAQFDYGSYVIPGSTVIAVSIRLVGVRNLVVVGGESEVKVLS